MPHQLQQTVGSDSCRYNEDYDRDYCMIPRMEPVDLKGTFAMPPKSLEEADITSRKRLLLVIDCANVGMEYGRQDTFNFQGVEVAMAHFSSQLGVNDLEVMGFIPAKFYRRKPRDGIGSNALMITDDWETMNNRYMEGSLAVVPPGLHDDEFIIDYAYKHGGFILSNDNFIDHLDTLRGCPNHAAIATWMNEHTHLMVVCLQNFFPMSKVSW
jgi:hypothetical protein